MMRDNARDFHKSPGPFDERKRKVEPGFDFSYIRPVNKRFGFTVSGGYSRNGTKEEFIENTWRGVRSTTNGNAFPHTPFGQPYLTSTDVRDGTKEAMRYSFGVTADYKLSQTTGCPSRFNTTTSISSSSTTRSASPSRA